MALQIPALCSRLPYPSIENRSPLDYLHIHVRKALAGWGRRPPTCQTVSLQVTHSQTIHPQTVSGLVARKATWRSNWTLDNKLSSQTSYTGVNLDWRWKRWRKWKCQQKWMSEYKHILGLAGQSWSDPCVIKLFWWTSSVCGKQDVLSFTCFRYGRGFWHFDVNRSVILQTGDRSKHEK